MSRLRVYVSGPLSHPDNYVELDNVRRAMDVGQAVIEAGYAPLVPHLSYYLDRRHPNPWGVWLDIDEPWVAASDVVLRIPGPSRGADRECVMAEEFGVPVVDVDERGAWQVALSFLNLRAAQTRLEDAKAVLEALKRDSVLAEADELIHGDRQSDYGHPSEDFGRTGRLWAAILGLEEVTPAEVGLCMAALKMSREVNAHKRDNLVDAAGYIGTVAMVAGE